MDENSVVVKQNPILIRFLLIIIAAIFLAFMITGLVIASNETDDFLPVALSISIPVICVCLFFAITAKLYIKAIDIYTETRMIRKSGGGKILYELEWQKVEKIQYNKLSLMSILMFGPTAFLIFLKEAPIDKKQPKIFLTYYSMKEVKKIQSIIPIKIQY